MPTSPTEERPPTFLDDPDRRREFEAELQALATDQEKLESEFDECERLSEADFAIRINARD